MSRAGTRALKNIDLDTADALHSAAIHLLRRLRTQDDALGLSAPRLSALSVVVFGGPVTVTQLAAAEQVLAQFEERTDLRRFRRELADSGIAGTDLHFRFYWLTAIWLWRRCKNHPDTPSATRAKAVGKFFATHWFDAFV